MQCPKCLNLDTRVIDSRLTEKNKTIRRRRECEKCTMRFTTFERIAITNLVVIKKDKTRESYDRSKLEHSIWIACGKRPITQDQINSMINELEEKWSINKKELSSQRIGKEVMERLRKLDNIAYIRFASVYKDFRDVEEFKNAVSNLEKK